MPMVRPQRFLPALAACAMGLGVATAWAQAPAGTAPTMQALEWQSQCRAEGCLAERTFLIRQGEQAQRVLTVRLLRRSADKGGRVELGFLGPLGVRIAPGVRVEALGPSPVTLPYAVCAGAGCSAETELDAATLQSLLQEKPLTTTFVLANGSQMVVKADLGGLKKAMEAWKP